MREPKLRPYCVELLIPRLKGGDEGGKARSLHLSEGPRERQRHPRPRGSPQRHPAVNGFGCLEGFSPHSRPTRTGMEIITQETGSSQGL